MFQILYSDNNGSKFVFNAADEWSKGNFIRILTSANIEYEVIERKTEMKVQLCGCMFNPSDTKVYTFADPDKLAKPGDIATVEVIDSFGDVVTKKVFVTKTWTATVTEVRELANSLGRTKLSRIKTVA